LKRLGKVLHIMNNKKIAIVHCDKIYNKIIGKKVVDEKVMNIGTIYDIFGPVQNPYVVIKLNEKQKNADKLPGKLLYIYTKRKR